MDTKYDFPGRRDLGAVTYNPEVFLLNLQPQGPTVDQTVDRILAKSGRTQLEVSLKDGRYQMNWDGLAAVHDATSKVRFGDGRERSASDYVSHIAGVANVSDPLGSGIRIDVRHKKDGEPDLVTTFWMYRERPEIVVQVSAISPKPISTDRMLPVVADGGIELDQGDSPEVLFVPFDNQNRVRYNSRNWSDEGESYEVGGTYDNRSRHGLIVGSLDHDTWKSAVQFRGRSGRRCAKMYAYSGATSSWTEDREPHGSVSGTIIRSPRMSVGGFSDWRDGLESFGQANGLLHPALPWVGNAPMGWNSWSAVKLDLGEPVVLAAADSVQQLGFQYVNLDAGWTNIGDNEIPKLVARIHSMGLKAGIYGGPFSAWQNSLDDKVEGTNGKYCLRDIVLKDHNGNPFPRVNGGWPVDPTHPGTRMRNAWTFARFKAWGFDFAKLDFMELGALEGRHYDPTIMTGIQAYNYGMKEVDEGLKGMFISLSMAPLFPHGYAHSRRISCDTFADIGYSEYLLNSATYGWWTQGSLYRFNDPDHTVVYKPVGDPIVSEEEGRTRLTASVVAGGMLLTGDDVRNPDARARVTRLFRNQEVVRLARRGISFRPIEGNTGAWSADTFVFKDGKNFYLAAFNFEREKSKVTKIDLGRAGLAGGSWRVTDLWTGASSAAAGTLTINLPAKASALLRLEM